MRAVADDKGRWMVAASIAVVLVLGSVWVVRVPMPGRAEVRPSWQTSRAAAVQLTRSDDAAAAFGEEAHLRDLRPLFLPTELNAAPPEPRSEPRQSVFERETLAPMSSSTDGQLTDDLPPVVKVGGRAAGVATLADAVSLAETGIGLWGFGRGEAAVAPLPARGGVVEIVAMKDGSRLLNEDLPLAARPPVDKSWGPLELLAVVDAAGLTGPLVITESSRVEEVDAHFRNYLAQNFRIGERLPPGFFRIVVAP